MITYIPLDSYGLSLMGERTLDTRKMCRQPLEEIHTLAGNIQSFTRISVIKDTLRSLRRALDLNEPGIQNAPEFRRSATYERRLPAITTIRQNMGNASASPDTKWS